MPDVRRGTVLSFSSSDWTALVQLDGADVESQIPVGQWVPSAMMAASAEVAVLVFGDTNTDDAVVLGPYGAVSLWNFPAIASATNGQMLIGNGTGMVLALITGTANRVTVTPGAGTLTLSGPQDLATSSAPQFASVSLGAATDNLVIQQKVTALASLGTVTLLGGSARAGLLTILESNGGRCAIYFLKGGLHATQEVSDPDAVYSNAKGTATSHNIYWSGSVYELENHSAGTDTYWISFMGI